MTTVPLFATPQPFTEVVSTSAGRGERNWYAVYTCVRHEKKVSSQLQQRGIEIFLPTYRARHQWQDRRVTVDLPLFPGYVFVRISADERLSVLTAAGVVRIVGVGGVPVPLPETDIEAIKQYITLTLPAEPYNAAVRGRRAYVTRGPLQGCRGTVLRRKGTMRLVLTLALVNSSIVVEVAAEDIELLPLRSDPRRLR